MAPKAAKAKPRPVTWKVVGGALSGGLIVRRGPEMKSSEFPEKLATGSLIQELELQGERMRYRRLSGSGPGEGWISTKFKGKDLLQQRPLRVWLLTAGTRGDLQPYLALCMGLQEAGYQTSIWSCEDYRSFVESYGMRFHPISNSVEQYIKAHGGVVGPVKEGGLKQKQKLENVFMDEDQERENAKKQKLQAYVSRWSLSLTYGMPVNGVSARELPSEWVMEAMPVHESLMLHKSAADAHAAWGDLACAEKFAKELERIAAKAQEEKEREEAAKWAEWAKWAEGTEGEQAGNEASGGAGAETGSTAPPAAAGSSAGTAPAAGAAAEPGLVAAAAAEPRAAPEPEAATAAPPSKAERALWAASEAAPEDEEAQAAPHVFWEVRRQVQEMENFSRGELLTFGPEAMFLGFFASDKSMQQHFLDELEREPPDLILYNLFYCCLSWVVECKFGIPSVSVMLQPTGMHMHDPRAPWITEEAWPLVQRSHPELHAYSSLEEARRLHEIKHAAGHWQWAVSMALVEAILEPIFGVNPLAEHGPQAYHRRLTRRNLVGFLSSVASARFLNFMGDFCKLQVGYQHYTGFWIMDDKAQTNSKSNMFGSPELMKRVEDFIAAGERPAYIGFGSCVSNRGRHWMIGLSVAALRDAQMRGIILGGWADLNAALLEDLVGPGDELGLLAYARENILFVDKVPQLWLFPKCSVIVIHGGVGTLAAAWTSGTPLIVLPVWMDQFENAWLNMLMGAGMNVSPIDETSPAELAYCLRQAATDPQYKRGAEAVQLSMMRDKGIQAATEYIDSFLLEEVPSGRWRSRYDDPE